MPPDIQEIAGLSDYAVASRYPGVSESVDAEEYHEAAELVEAVVYWAEHVISLRAPDSIRPTDSL